MRTRASKISKHTPAKNFYDNAKSTADRLSCAFHGSDSKEVKSWQEYDSLTSYSYTIILPPSDVSYCLLLAIWEIPLSCMVAAHCLDQCMSAQISFHDMALMYLACSTAACPSSWTSLISSLASI